jgi:hypothetical protein
MVTVTGNPILDAFEEVKNIAGEAVNSPVQAVIHLGQDVRNLARKRPRAFQAAIGDDLQIEHVRGKRKKRTSRIRKAQQENLFGGDFLPMDIDRNNRYFIQATNVIKEIMPYRRKRFRKKRKYGKRYRKRKRKSNKMTKAMFYRFNNMGPVCTRIEEAAYSIQPLVNQCKYNYDKYFRTTDGEDLMRNYPHQFMNSSSTWESRSLDHDGVSRAYTNAKLVYRKGTHMRYTIRNNDVVDMQVTMCKFVSQCYHSVAVNTLFDKYQNKQYNASVTHHVTDTRSNIKYMPSKAFEGMWKRQGKVLDIIIPPGKQIHVKIKGPRKWYDSHYAEGVHNSTYVPGSVEVCLRVQGTLGHDTAPNTDQVGWVPGSIDVHFELVSKYSIYQGAHRGIFSQTAGTDAMTAPLQAQRNVEIEAA